MYIENACRASKQGEITPKNLKPTPKNPVIASFFNQIGNADELGSGTRNLYKYSKLYSGKAPELIAGDIFRILIPLDDAYFLMRVIKLPNQLPIQLPNQVFVRRKRMKILNILKRNPEISQSGIAVELGMDINTVKYYTKKLKKQGVLERRKC